MKNVRVRAAIAALLLLFLVNIGSFLEHARYFLSGAVTEELVRGNWPLVIANVALFVAFVGLLRVRKSIDWSSAGGYGVYTAFIVSLFVEMYGVPLTIFLGQGVVQGPGTPPATIMAVPLPGVTLAMNLWMVAGVVVTVAGMALVAAGWAQVYRADGLVTGGLYRYSRNPQYVGIILIALGWVIGWPTVLTLALFPVLVAAYIYLAVREQRDMVDRYGETYEDYAGRVPLLV